MTRAWRTIRVFISSTFRDMHQERDRLLRFVFPELRECLRPYRVRLVEVDLRWGVSEEDVRGGRTLDVCLDEVDSCRPYFIGILGFRYGHVPENTDQSLTCQEITHAVLHGRMPRQITDLDRLLTDNAPPGGFSAAERDCLCRCYSWREARRKYILKQELSDGDREALRGVFGRIAAYQRGRSLFFFRSAAFTERLAGDDRSVFFDEDPRPRGRLEALKQGIRAADLPCVEYDDFDAFDRAVRDSRWEKVRAELDPAAPEARDWFDSEQGHQNVFVAQRVRHFVGRENVFRQMGEFAAGHGDEQILLVGGTPGSGKSGLLARFVQGIERTPPARAGRSVAWHFVGASPASTGLRGLLRRISADLRPAGSPRETVPSTLADLLSQFPDRLRAAADRGPVLLVIDALNQLDPWDNAQRMTWFPDPLPPRVRVVCSTLPGPARDALVARVPRVRIAALPPLGRAETAELVDDYQAEVGRDFPSPEVRAALLDKVSAGNPLHIRVALEELRLFGLYDDLGKRIAQLPADTAGLFQQVLARIEGDFADAPGLVPTFLSLLATLRRGMPAGVFQRLLRAWAPGDAVERYPDLCWARLMRAFYPYLFERGEFLDFFHGQVAEAVRGRYLNDPEAVRETQARIAAFCADPWAETDPCALAYARRYRIHHLAGSHQWSAIDALLRDSTFLLRMREAGFRPASALVEVIRTHPEESEERIAASDILRRAVSAPEAGTREVAMDGAVGLDDIAPLLMGAEHPDEATRIAADIGLFQVYRHRSSDGRAEQAWEGARALRARMRGPLGWPRKRVVSSLMGLLVATYVDCGQDRSQLEVLVEFARNAAWDLLPFGPARSRRGQAARRAMARALLAVFRPGLSLAMVALKRVESAANLRSAQAFFNQSRSEREQVRGYFPFLEPRPIDLAPLCDLMVTNCTRRCAFHYNFIMGCAVAQGSVQPDAVVAILRRMAEQESPNAVYEATRSLYYVLSIQRTRGVTPDPGHERLLCQWLQRHYHAADYTVRFQETCIPGRSLAEYAGRYLASHMPPEQDALRLLIDEAAAAGQGQSGLLSDLVDALGILGQHGQIAYALGRISDLLRDHADAARAAKEALVVTLGRVYTHYPEAVAEWTETQIGAPFSMEDVLQHPGPPAAAWQGGSDLLLADILANQADARAILFKMLDGLPCARSLPGYLHYVARSLLDLLIEGEIPGNAYAAR